MWTHFTPGAGLPHLTTPGCLRRPGGPSPIFGEGRVATALSVGFRRYLAVAILLTLCSHLGVMLLSLYRNQTIK